MNGRLPSPWSDWIRPAGTHPDAAEAPREDLRCQCGDFRWAVHIDADDNLVAECATCLRTGLLARRLGDAVSGRVKGSACSLCGRRCTAGRPLCQACRRSGVLGRAIAGLRDLPSRPVTP